MCSKNDTQTRVVLCLYSHNLEMGTMPSSEVFDYYKHLCSNEVPYSVCKKCWVKIQQQKEPGADPQMFCIDTLRRAKPLCTKGDSIEDNMCAKNIKEGRCIDPFISVVAARFFPEAYSKEK